MKTQLNNARIDPNTQAHHVGLCEKALSDTLSLDPGCNQSQHEAVPIFEILIKTFKIAHPSHFTIDDAALYSRLTASMSEGKSAPMGVA